MPRSRTSGILLHITSLPSAYGIGDLGPAAYRFADWLAHTRQQLWQLLPLGPVGKGASPYTSPSTFAGNPLLIAIDPLLEQDLLTDDDVAPLRALPQDHVAFDRLMPAKRAVLETAFQRFEAASGASDRAAFRTFWTRNADWLDDYALFMALRDAHDGAPWTDWDPALAYRDPDALDTAREVYASERRMYAFWQFLFQRQWAALRSYCHARRIRFFGDVPIYVAHDSADVWAHQRLFQLDSDGAPTAVAGVPPDYFSPKGQRWGNPLYRWDRMAHNGFAWWMRRFQHVLGRIDLARVDHFRGFASYWRIPASASTAIKGSWADGPGAAFFRRLADVVGLDGIVAEDLGTITPDVTELRDAFDLPGMAVLQFAFENDPSNAYLPHNFRSNCVAYTGTHDNNTICGWWADEPSDEDRAFARRYLEIGPNDAVHRRAIRALMASVAQRVVVPMQDVLGLGAAARMNTPGEPEGNWTWRLTPDQLEAADAAWLEELTLTYGRAPV